MFRTHDVGVGRGRPGGRRGDARATPAAAADELTEQLRKALDDEVTAFHVVELDVRDLADAALAEGKASLPAVTAKGELVDVTLPAAPARLRDEGVDTGVLRSGRRAEHVPLPAEHAYRLGNCPDGDACATATILDEAATMVSGLVVAPDVGTSHYEPVDQLLGTDRYPGLHVVYNDAATLDLVIDDETAMLDRDRDSSPSATRRSPRPTPATATRFVGRSTRIVLDGDRTFFAANPATAFSRQLAIFNDFTLLYELIEPLSVENPESVRWQLDLR